MLRILLAAGALLSLGCGGDLNHGATIDTAGGEVVAAGVSGSFIATLDEWAIDLPMDSLPAGRYTFRAQNSGSVTHALEIEGTDVEWKTDALTPRSATEITADLEPGVYEVYCPVVDSRGAHKDRGMRGQIVVR